MNSTEIKTNHWARLLKIFAILFFMSLGCLTVLIQSPVVHTPIRLLIAGTGLLAYLILFLLCIKLFFTKSKIGVSLFVLVLIPIGWYCYGMIPGWKLQSPEGFRQVYRSKLLSYQHAPYVWGGERRNGVDCSGLVRAAMIDAILDQGIERRDPHLLGPLLLNFWWHDLSAHDLLSGKGGYTQVINSAQKLSSYDHSTLEPGDLAITSDGTHVLAYLGNQRWIEASPIKHQVVEQTVTPESTHYYFNQEVVITRWKFLK